MTTDAYGIAAGYRTNGTAESPPVPYRDRIRAAKLYQMDVYRRALALIRSSGSRSVADVGCGTGWKLARMIAPACGQAVGFDTPDTIAECSRRFPHVQWRALDLEKAVPDGSRFDVVICADVIEHLIDPDALCRFLRGLCHERSTVLISTPERDLTRGLFHQGPPGNPHHVREWSFREFSDYLQTRGFRVEAHEIVRDRDTPLLRRLWLAAANREDFRHRCQMVTCRPA